MKDKLKDFGAQALLYVLDHALIVSAIVASYFDMKMALWLFVSAFYFKAHDILEAVRKKEEIRVFRF